MSEHTKEPWTSKPTAGSDGEYCTIISESEGRSIARHVKPSDAEYICALKAQRDELLAALNDLVDCISETRGKSATSALLRAHAAIANAEKDKP